VVNGWLGIGAVASGVRTEATAAICGLGTSVNCPLADARCVAIPRIWNIGRKRELQQVLDALQRFVRGLASGHSKHVETPRVGAPDRMPEPQGDSALRRDIETTIGAYLKRHPEDAALVSELRSLMESRDVTSRNEFQGHVTCGAILVRPGGQLLLIHHRALDIWRFPGGHLEGQDSSLRGAALRELEEETGIEKSALSVTDSFFEIPILIDRHVIPPNPVKNEPAHPHYNFLFVFRANNVPVSLQREEVQDYGWLSAERAAQILKHQMPNLYDRLDAIGLLQ
jgi:8-oxo-dGTP pyrophosphatase MutT (NUDIX family)